MRLSSLSYGIIGLLVGGCSSSPTGSTDSPETASHVSALTAAKPAGNARARGPRLGELDPQSQRRAKGARLDTREEAAERASRTPQLVEVKPSALALERIREHQSGRGDSSSQAEPLATPAAPSATADSAMVAGGTLSGSDLVLAAPSTSSASAARSAAPPAAPTTYAASLATSLPTSVDNSKGKSFPEIRNQGGLGSCEAFAIGYYQATYEIGRLAGWDNKSASSTNATKLSPKWFYNMNNGGDNRGTGNGQHYDLLMESGALTWADFPYDGDASNPLNYRQWPLGTTLWNKALRFKGLSYTSVAAPTDAASMQTVKSLLVNGRVLTFDTSIDPWRFDHLDNDSSTTLDDAFTNQWVATWLDGSAAGEGHAMTVVGYDDNVWIDLDNDNQVDAAEKGAFKIANSWGQDWDHGNAGFVWLSYDALGVTSQVIDPSLQPNRIQPMWSLNTVVVRSNYQPNLTAEFALTMVDRNEMMDISLAEPDKQNSFIDWYPRAFSQGGAYAFDGTTRSTPMSATFVLDLTEMAPSYGDSKYGFWLTNFGSTAAKLSGLTFVDRLKNNLRTASTDPAATVAQNSRGEQTLRYRYQDPAHVPQLAFTPSTSVNFGNVALGGSATQLLSIKNQGTGDAWLTSFTLGNSLFWLDELNPIKLQPGSTTLLHAHLAPAATQSETTTLTVRNTSQNLPSAALTLTGTGASSDDSAPLQVFITQQNNPVDNSIAMRVELKNKTTQSAALSTYRVSYFFSDPYIDPTGLIWDTYYNSGASPLGAKLRHVYLGKILGPRKADAALDFTFPAGASLAAGGSLIFQGSLHRADYSWYPDENDDWSRYLRRDGMAEGAVVQELASKKIVFGSTPEFAAGANQLAMSPSQVGDQATITYSATDPAALNTFYSIVVYNSTGTGMIWLNDWIGTLGTRTVQLNMAGYNAGTYTLVLQSNSGAPLDGIEFKKL